MHRALSKIIQSFDEAAADYDQYASLQKQVALDLVSWSNPDRTEKILDIGSGTGFVLEAARDRWRDASLTALDQAPTMLLEARRKLPQLKTLVGDAKKIEVDEPFDVIFSSLMLHWLPEPQKTLLDWQKNLTTNGKLFVAVLTNNSFKEWRAVSEKNHLKDGLWTMPSTGFADAITTRREIRDIPVLYPSAREFLLRLKAIGAATSHPDHKPLKISLMRQLLKEAARPFQLTYQVLYMEIPPHGKV